MKKQKSYRFN